MKKLFILFCLCILFIDCNKKDSSSSNIPTNINITNNKLNIKDIIGKYKGTISCNDCEEVELNLKTNNTYDITLHLSAEIKTENSLVKEKGKYTWDQQTSTLTLDKYNFIFKVKKDTLFYITQEEPIISLDEILIKKQ